MIVHKDALSDHQDEFLFLDESRVLTPVGRDYCPLCNSVAFLWRVFGINGATFTVRCSNDQCGHRVPGIPVRQAKDAVLAWRLAIALQRP